MSSGASARNGPVGFCGVGLLGLPIVRRLLAANYELHIWNRTADKLSALRSEGAVIAESPAAVARAAPVVCLCLLDATAVEHVVFGRDGIESSRGVDLLIDHSSIPPAKTRIFSERLLASTGTTWVDAPVSGGVAGAEAGTLAVMAGGPLEAVERAYAVMRAYASRVTHVGASGCGQTVKLCNQTIVATTLAAIAEAVALARSSGIDPELLPQALQGGWADSKLLQLFVPRMITPPENMIGAVTTLLKDLDAVADLGCQTRTPLPVGAAAQQLFRLAASLGFGAMDLSAVARVFDRLAGAAVVRGD